MWGKVHSARSNVETCITHEPDREALAPELASRRYSTFHERQWQSQPGELIH